MTFSNTVSLILIKYHSRKNESVFPLFFSVTENVFCVQTSGVNENIGNLLSNERLLCIMTSVSRDKTCGLKRNETIISMKRILCKDTHSEGGESHVTSNCLH